jgi:enamine deaminase RidA (YjgF/YER057c/UK114 family)
MKREVIKTDKAPKAIGPYEQALKLDGWVFTSGQIPLDPRTAPWWRRHRGSDPAGPGEPAGVLERPGPPWAGW